MAALASASEKKVWLRSRPKMHDWAKRTRVLDSRPCRKNADAIVRCHHAVAAVDLGIVEAGTTDARLQIVGNDESGNAVKKTKHPDMGANPVGERLRPGRLGKGVEVCT